MFVNKAQKQQIAVWLEGLGTRVHWLADLSQRPDAWEHDLTCRLAAERALHTSLEYVTDISSLVIDALVMRDPGGYSDIVKVLVEENVLAANWFQAFEPVFEFRTRLLRNHDQITPEDVRFAVDTYATMFRDFIESIHVFLDLPST